MDQFWLTDERFARIAPHLPTDTPGQGACQRPTRDQWYRPRAQVRRPLDVYGPKKTLYSRFVRWAAKGGLGRAVRDPGPGPTQVLRAAIT
ncbi:transposase [Methylobacterium sp. WL122]|nr:transposase [Methylobacterium sp. WL122]